MPLPALPPVLLRVAPFDRLWWQKRHLNNRGLCFWGMLNHHSVFFFICSFSPHLLLPCLALPCWALAGGRSRRDPWLRSEPSRPPSSLILSCTAYSCLTALAPRPCPLLSVCLRFPSPLFRHCPPTARIAGVLEDSIRSFGARWPDRFCRKR